jgi:hypothetical protein
MSIYLNVVSLAHIHHFFCKVFWILFKLSHICAPSTCFMVNMGNQIWGDDNIRIFVGLFMQDILFDDQYMNCIKENKQSLCETQVNKA